MNECRRENNWWEHYPHHKLWCNDLCPLVPRFNYSPKDEHNSSNGGVHWLFFHIWTMSHVSLQFDAEISPNTIGCGVILPYLRIFIGPRHMYGPINFFFYKYLTRKGTLDR